MVRWNDAVLTLLGYAYCHRCADHGQELAPTNVNDAIPREYLTAFERAGLIDAERKRILGLDIDIDADH